MNWIQDVIKASSEAETPVSFIEWSAIAAIAAVASNNVYLNRKGIYHLRPNIYAMLMAKSGLGKGFPINISKKLVQLSKATRVIAGRSTIQAIVKDLATKVTSEDGTEPFSDSRGFLVSGEFSTALIQDADALTIMTDLYDCHWNEEWTNKLKHQAIEHIIRPNLTLLGGSSPTHFFDSIPDVNIFGGFIGRMLIIYEEKRSKINDLLSDVEGIEDHEIAFPYNELSEWLIKIKEDTSGTEYGKKFSWTGAAARVFAAWYLPFRTDEAEDKTGFNQRLPDHILKVAMCLSLSESTDLKIRENHIEEAIDKVQTLRYSTKRVSEGKGKDPLAPQAKMILDVLISSPEHTILRSRLIQKGYGDWDSCTLDRILDQQFIEMNWVTKERVSYENKKGITIYDWEIKMTSEAIGQYKQYVEVIK